MITGWRQLARTPFDIAAGNPVFEREISRLHRVWSRARMRRTSRQALAHAALAVIAAWLLLWAASASGYGAAQPNYIYQASSNVVFWLLLIALGSGTLLDMQALRAALPSISSEVNARRWELLRLTPLRESSIVSAKHAAAQLRVWRALALVVGLRAATAALFMVNVFGLSYVLSGMPPLARNDLAAIPLILATVAVLTVLFVFEPLWRVRTMTALGMVISSYVLDSPLSTLIAAIALLAVWLAQAVIFMTLLTALWTVLFPVVMFGADALVASAIVLGFGVVIAVSIFGFHTVLVRWCLRRVHRRISRVAN